MKARAEVALRATVLAYLKAHNTMSLATVGPEGPWAASIFYAHDELTLYFLSDPKTRHGRNLAQEPQVGITISEDYHDWRKIRGIQMEALVTPITADEDMTVAVTAYAEKYPFVASYLKVMATPFPKALNAIEGVLRRLRLPEFKAPPTQFYKVTPRRLWFTDNEKGLGHREELPL